jgi:hypothetical protein
MPVPQNIDCFNKATLLVLDKLYQAFPVPIELSASKIATDTLPPDATYDESFQCIEPVVHTIEFLRKEGFIEYAEHCLAGTTFLHVRLTSKSLALLGHTPSALEPHVSISEKFRNLLKGGIKEVSSETAKKAVEVLFTNGPALFAIGQSAAGPGS